LAPMMCHVQKEGCIGLVLMIKEMGKEATTRTRNDVMRLRSIFISECFL